MRTLNSPKAYYNTIAFENDLIKFMSNIGIKIISPNQDDGMKNDEKLKGDEIEFYLDFHGIGTIRKGYFELLGHFKGKNKELNIEDKILDDEWRERVLRNWGGVWGGYLESAKMKDIKEWLTM